MDVCGLSFVDPFLIWVISLSVTETAPVSPSTTTASHQMPLLMQLYTSPDYRSPLDPNAKVQSDKRIYAEVRNRSKYKYTKYTLDNIIVLACI